MQALKRLKGGSSVENMEMVEVDSDLVNQELAEQLSSSEQVTEGKEKPVDLARAQILQERKRHIATEKSSGTSVCRTVREFLNSNPFLFKRPVSPSFRNFECRNNVNDCSIESDEENECVTEIVPRVFIPAVTWKDETVPSKTSKSTGKNLPQDWKTVETEDGSTLYVHIPTGLRHYMRPMGMGFPLLKRRPLETFKDHLEQADKAEIEGQPVWKLIEAAPFFRRNESDLLEDVWDEKAAFHALSIAVYRPICEIFNEALAHIQANGFQFDSRNTYKRDTIASADNGLVGEYDWILDMSFVNDDTEGYQNIASIISVTKVDYKFPCTRYECSSRDAACRDDLIKFYLETETGRSKLAEDNVLVQIRTYLGLNNRRYGIITSLNTWTFVKLGDDDVLYVSPTFNWNHEPTANMKMCVFEMILRFMVSAIGSYKFGGPPQDSLEHRPEFVKRYLRQNPFQDGSDPDWFGSVRTIRRKGSRQKYRPVIGPKTWADMEDPRRNAPGSHLTWEESLSELGALEGDAKLDSFSDLCPVLRKRFGTRELSLKTIFLNHPRDRDEPTDPHLVGMLRKEAKFYQDNVKIQDKLIPRYFGFRRLQLGVCLITEYVGPTFANLGKITREQMDSALTSLSDLHEHGILHGTLEWGSSLCNVVWSEELRKAFWINFSFCFRRHEDNDQQGWKLVADREFNLYRQELLKILDIPPAEDQVQNVLEVDVQRHENADESFWQRLVEGAQKFFRRD